MTALSQESRALFRSARTAMSPDGDARERVRARLAAKVGAAAVGAATGATIAKAAGGATAAKAGVATGTAGATGAKAGSIALVAKIAAPLALAGAAAVATPHVAPDFTQRVGQRIDTIVHTTPPERPALPPGVRVTNDRAELPKANEPASPPPVTPAPDAPTPITAEALPDAPKVVPTKTRTKPAASSATAEEEAAIVDAMERALRGGDARRAAALASEHEQKFPRGTLSEEREGGRVLARCAMDGPRARSKDAADTFLAAHPRSPMRGRILAACTSPSEKE